MNNTTHDNTINFMYFMSNYPHNFIYQVWENKGIADHFNSKFNGYCDQFGKSNFGFLYWFYNIDTDHQRTLLNWVNTHYKAFSHLKL